MAMADRQAHTLWEGSLLGGKGDTEFASSGIGRYPVTWAARTESPDGKTSPEELLAAAHATCYAMAFSHFLAQAGNAPERLHVTSTVSLDPKEGGGVVVTRSALEVSGASPGTTRTASSRPPRRPRRAARSPTPFAATSRSRSRPRWSPDPARQSRRIRRNYVILRIPRRPRSA